MRTDPAPRDAHGELAGSPLHPDMRFVRDVLQEKRASVVRFLDRMSCVPRILAAKNASLGTPLCAAELEEIAQDTMIVVWKKLPEFEGRSSLETWVFRIAIFELMNHVRLASHRRRVDMTEGELIAAVGNEEAAAYEDYSFVYDALDRLPEIERLVVRAKHFEQRSFSEVGESLGISENTAKTRYYRAMSRLRIELRAHEGEDS